MRHILTGNAYPHRECTLFIQGDDLGNKTSETDINIIKSRGAALIERELTILGRERRPRLQKTKTAITEIKAVQ